MTFKILYIEDEEPHYTRIEEAVEEHNRRLDDPDDSLEGEKLLLDRLKTPDFLVDKLDLGFDVVLADVVYKIGDNRGSRLSEILDKVEVWKDSRLGDISLPIIAYTGTGKRMLRKCLEERSRLFDLWDKNTAEPQYVAWRMSRLASEVARDRPDALMQRLVRDMSVGATWHREVAAMAESYNRGCSERDQLERMTSSVVEIGKRVGSRKYTKSMWEKTKLWESLGLASTEQMRGHARHVANVFWLGYYLIYHELLRDIFGDFWGVLRQKRLNWNFSDGGRLEDISRIWFIASLFHDSAYCCQKAKKVIGKLGSLLEEFQGVDQSGLKMPDVWGEVFRERLVDLPAQFDDRTDDGKFLAEKVSAVAQASLENLEPDHGVIAAWHLINSTKAGTLELEAARAMALHNCFPDLEERAQAAVTWQREPIACLLIVCDQVQAWDRERGDDHFAKWPSPERAELSRLEVAVEDGKPQVTIGLNYIVSSRVLRSEDWFAGVKNELEGILRDHPDRCLRRIKGDWPFQLKVEPSLSGVALNTEMKYG